MSHEWALVEILGRVRRAGRVFEVTRYGVAGIVVQIPRADGSFGPEEFYAGRALFSVHYLSEAEARRAAGFGSTAALPGHLHAPDEDASDEDAPDEDAP